MITATFRARRRLAVCAALAVSVAGIATMVSPADAGMKHRHHAMMGKYAPAHLKPGYVGAPGFVGGPAVSTGPMAPMGGQPGLLGNGGLVGTGILPQTGLFYGVPVLGQVGL